MKLWKTPLGPSAIVMKVLTVLEDQLTNRAGYLECTSSILYKGKNIYQPNNK